MNQRVVKPNGPMIVRLRREKGWDQADLARQAVCNKRTMERREHSVPVFPRIVRVVAEALGMAPHLLQVEAANAPLEPGAVS